MTRNVPRHIADAVQRYDRRLRLRWSREKRLFVLERKLDNSIFAPRPIKYGRGSDGRIVEYRCPEYSDRYIAYHDGYLPICRVGNADSRILHYIYNSDSFRYGRNFIREYEENERKREELQDRRDSSLVKDVSGESYDRLQYAHGERMSMRG